MWERTLQDLIRGLRANKNDERKFISQAIDEIRQEVRSKDMELKAGAILKMTFVCAVSSDHFDIITYNSLVELRLLPPMLVGYARVRPCMGKLSYYRGHELSQIPS
jgi:hypothetical protein